MCQSTFKPQCLCLADTNADCTTEGYECNRKDERPLCSCTGKGDDLCRMIGACKETPCAACNRCLGDIQAFVIGTYATEKNPATLATQFYNYCIQMNRTAPICYAAQVAVSNSPKGNLGRRAAGLCSALKECDATSLGATCRYVFVHSSTSTSQHR